MKYRVVGLAIVLTALSCTKPQQPTIIVKESKVTAVDMGGITVLVHVDAFNPNSFGLTVQSVTGHALLGGKYDLGTVTVSTPVNLPAGQHTDVQVPMTMKWENLGTLAAIASNHNAMPYTMTGDVKIGGDHLAVTLPFTASGTVTQAQLGDAAIRSIPGLNLPK